MDDQPPVPVIETIDDASAIVRYVLEKTTAQARDLLSKLGLDVEVSLTAYQLTLEGFGPFVVALTHPLTEEDPTAADRIVEIAGHVQRIYSS